MKKQTKSIVHAAKGSSTPSRLAARSAKSFALVLLISAVFFCLAALLFTNVDLPHKLFGQLAAALTAVSLFASAYVFAKSSGELGLISGFILGLSFFLTTLFISGIVMKYETTGRALIILGMFTVSGMLGGYAGSSSAYKKKIA